MFMHVNQKPVSLFTHIYLHIFFTSTLKLTQLKPKKHIKLKMMFDITAVRPSIYAAIFSFVSSLIGIISFVTPYWLASDGRAPIRRFNNLGLWEVCFESFEEPSFRYDLVYRGCRWIFDKDFYLLSYFLKPPFFVATQTLYTLGFVFLLLAAIGVLAIQLCFVIDKEMYAMKALSIIMFLSALFCTTACIIFGIKGDDRDWMPDPEHNYLSWSFALAVVGCFFQWVSSILFWVENRILIKKEAKKHSNSFTLEPTSVKH